MGYELLYRPVTATTPVEAAGPLGDLMTAEVLFGSVSIGIDRLVGNKKFFYNASRGVLVGEAPILLSPEQTVIEVLESVAPDEEVLAGCRRLRDAGFTLALDDVHWFDDAEPFIEMASIVKIDLQATPWADLPALVDRCRPYEVALVAEKVETTEELSRCDALGFDYFQGYLLARPCHVPGRVLDSSRLARVRMAARLLDRECPIPELDRIIRGDPAMTYQLLQLAGIGAAKGMRRTVQTVREALVVVGWRRLQSWVSLLLIGGRGAASNEELTIALTRARMCELVARDTNAALSEIAFTAGMLSTFDMLLNMTLEDALRDLPIDGALRRAVLNAEGPIGQLVADVADFQMGRPENATRSRFGDDVLSSAALEALIWAVELTSTFSEGDLATTN